LTAGFGTYTLNEDGNGPAVVTDLFYNPITMVNPPIPATIWSFGERAWGL
jgi:hypothetical protein